MAPLVTLRSLVENADPSSPAIILAASASTPGATTTYAQLASNAQAFAQLLSAVPRQSVVATVIGNTPDFVAAYLGITGFASCVALPMNPATSRDEAANTFKDSNTSVLITDDAKCASRLAADALGIRVVVTTSIPRERGTLDRRPAPGDKALYLFTSGTTAKPKLVPLTHHNLVTSIGNIRNSYELDFTDRTYLVMPLFHIHGLQSALGATLASGGTIILPAAGKFSAEAFWTDVETHKATWYTAVPTIHQILLARADQDRAITQRCRKQLRFIRSCSASLAPATLEKLEALTGSTVLEAYAMSEAAHQMTSNPLPQHGPRKPGSVGRATNVQLSIRDTETLRALAEHGAVGEVCVRGDNVTDGYVNRPEANAEAFTKERWFRTGDNGYLDKDGYLFLTGRLKEIVNRGGEKISPAEIDGVLLAMADVNEAVAFGMPSEKYGEELACAVVAKEGSKLTAAAVVKHLQGKIAREKVPAESNVFVVDAIPKSSIGKVQRRNLTAHFTALRKAKL